MQIEDIKLNCFRNYESLKLSPGAGLNIITGENAQGKTNAVEAIFLCAFGRSHRTPRDSELIMHDCSGAYVGLNVRTASGTRLIEMKLPSSGKKQIYLDRLGARLSGELIGILNVVMFSPEDLELVKGAPAERRKFMDMELSQLRPAYYLTLQRYNKALKERNALLHPEAASKRTPDELRRELYVWDEQLIACAGNIMTKRREFIEKLNSLSGPLHKVLSGGRERLDIRYAPNINFDGGDPSDRFADALYSGVAEDIRRGTTGCGPHRDDLDVLINGISVRVFGSQGQQRTSALSLKLSELELLREDRGEPPVLILDDVLSELDPLRQRALLEAISGCQSFLTCTGLESIKKAGMSLPDVPIYICRNGTLEREFDK